MMSDHDRLAHKSRELEILSRGLVEVFVASGVLPPKVDHSHAVEAAHAYFKMLWAMLEKSNSPAPLETAKLAHLIDGGLRVVPMKDEWDRAEAKTLATTLIDNAECWSLFGVIIDEKKEEIGFSSVGHMSTQHQLHLDNFLLRFVLRRSLGLPMTSVDFMGDGGEENG